ncbi:Dip2/Utp12 family-domain-containing protein [Staphylotrichum tortipilum]|uniref:Dip2/Utp12 family-domain-containing protein n=1 Tax=Staphylotrichum tortipilum TaxID=2831512 RepID=A0AAN6MCQ6_9PEZI|nr:Dip2/Utp12 family-domain-containing protein [Staphylotrichum longicolle]
MAATKRKAATTIAKPVVRQSAKATIRTRINEAKASVSTGLSKPDSKTSTEARDAEDQSGSDDEEAGSENEDQQPTDQKTASAPSARQKQGQDEADSDAVMQEGGDNSDGEPAAPTFGDLMRGNSTIDVPASLAAQAAASQTSQLQAQQRPTAPISATSLGTVLNQALRTDDADLLESCLQTTDVKIIENTINRMDSSLASILLSKLSARMHRRPGRAFGLMRWMQWTLIAHGGALVTQPDLVARLGELSRVLEERSRGLSSLLALKGKLDMLDSQMKFRKSVKAAGASRSRGGDEEELSEEEEEDADEPGVVYVEGQETLVGGALLTNGTAGRGGVDEDDDFPAGAAGLSDSEEESDEEFEEEVDEELADAESLDEDEVDHDDVEDEEEESEGEESRRPAKVRRVSERIAKRK